MNTSIAEDRYLPTNRQIRIRQQALFSMILLITIAWIAGMIITHTLSPFNELSLIAVTVIGIVWIGMSCLAWYFRSNEGNQSGVLAYTTALILFASMLLLSVESLFGDQVTLLLNGHTPTVAFGYSIAIMVAFCLMTIRHAIRASSLFTCLLMLMLGLHIYAYLDDYKTYYAIGVMAGLVFMLTPVTIALLYGYYRVNNSEIELADIQLEQSTKAHRQAAIEAKRDSLTGMLNRFGMWEELEKAYVLNPGLGVITIKLSNEAQMGDFHSSHALDQLYRDMARVLTDCTESQSEYARREGGEFVLWFSYIDEPDELEKKGCKIIAMLNDMSKSKWKGRAQFHGAGRICAQDRPPSQVVEETLFLIQHGKAAGISFNTLS